MKPGSTIMRDASIAVASALISGRTATIFLSSIRTSAFSKSPTAGSKLSTTPPLSRVRTGPRWANAGGAIPATAVAASVAAADLIRARRLTFTDVDRGNLALLPVVSIVYSSDPVADPTGAGLKHVENDDRRQAQIMLVASRRATPRRCVAIATSKLAGRSCHQGMTV